MANNENECANLLNKLILQHSNNIVNNTSITEIHKTGVIIALPNNTETRYSVQIDGTEYKIPAPSYLNLAIKDVVIVCFYQGNPNKKFILTKKEWTCW
jgi:hypothetical protein